MAIFRQLLGRRGTMDQLILWAKEMFSFVMHVDQYLDLLLARYGSGFFFVMFFIIFCETGLVVTPFLPGDSLLFAAGALLARNNLPVNLMAVTLFVAAVLGDFVNYHIGKYLGPRAFDLNPRFLKRSYLVRTQEFFEKYGPKAVVLARFVPIVRTFAPFLAGVGTMRYGRFFIYNVAGALLWVGIFLYAGFFFGDLPAVRKNFTLVIFAIIGVSILPMLWEVLRSCYKEKKA